eukprot:CAMPEP_0180433154 /NCGR_PEP_ID=MMETSP1036_2-20121128/9281_1 /TAXON_ID=632150 /ORGANISM="Azadinium spinosum, Strain 3D9" /LENGTH=157 /DNA_ID=CAMNT_0022438963 /DNA_START=41 /DNA_END=511 /DNA_ORIENTATION=+
MAAESQYPRGSGGCVLYPGTLVLLHGLKSGSAKSFNGQEATCETWNPDEGKKGRMYVKLKAGEHAGMLIGMKTANMRKVLAPEPKDDEMDRVMDVFEKHDMDGDGIMCSEEFKSCLRSLGLGETALSAFLLAVDKDGDGTVRYEEFVRWALSPTEQS